MAHPHPRPFGALLRQHRILAGFTQEALAERAGLSRRAISDLERGVNHTPRPGTLDLLAQALQLSATEMAEFSSAAQWERLERRSTPLPHLLLDPPIAGTQQTTPDAVVALFGGEAPAGGRVRPPERHSAEKATLEPERSIPNLATGVVGQIPTGGVLTPQPLSAPHLLPTPPTPLFGRAQEVQTICTQLQRQTVRLFTLTGMAGVGKTRLALEAAAEVRATFPDGVRFISLSALADPVLVLPTIAEALGLRETNTLPILTLLVNALQEQHLLLVLDNFEQVISTAPTLATLLETCPLLKLLVTSREALHLRAEHQFVVSPLELPTLPPERAQQKIDLAVLAKNPAMQLFIYRVQAAQPDFRVNPDITITLARICQRLEGIPLAMELAAPRLKVLSPNALLAHLERRLHVLIGGARDLPERQRTMRTTIAWSYELLSSSEQALFRRLSVFVNSWRLTVAEQVCQAAGLLDLDLLEGLSSLLDKSLLHQEPGSDGEPRFRMLSVLREFGLEQLEEAGELTVTCASHAAAFLSLAEEAETHLLGSDQKVWLDRLEEEHDNLRAALRWTVEQASQAATARNEAQAQTGWEAVAQVMGSFFWFWLIRCHFSDLQRFLTQVLAVPVDVAGDVRAKILFHAAWAKFAAGDKARRAQLIEESLTLYRTLVQRSPAELSLQRGLIAALNGAGHIALSAGEYADLEHLCEESLMLCRQSGERWREAEALHTLALGYARRGEVARGRVLCEASLAICRELEEKGGTSILLLSLGCFAWRQGDTASALQYVEESLVMSQQSVIPVTTTLCLVWLGIILVARGQSIRDARLWGAAERLGETLGTSGLNLFDQPLNREIDPAARAYYTQAETAARSLLGEAAFTAAWVEWRSLSLDQIATSAKAEALDYPSDSFPPG